MTAWPAGAQRPTASNLNLVAGQSVTNTVVVALGTGGAISLYNLSGSTNMVVDIIGWYASTTSTVIAPPRQLMDTRAGSRPSTARPPARVRWGPARRATCR